MIDEYASQFFLLLTRNEITETDAQSMSQFIGGLQQQYQNILKLFDPLTILEAHYRALLIEKQSRSGSLAWITPPSQTSATLSITAFAVANALGPMAPAPQPLHVQPDTAPLGPSSHLDALQCFSYGKPDHRQTACPKIGRHTLLVDGKELKGSDDVIADDDVPRRGRFGRTSSW